MIYLIPVLVFETYQLLFNVIVFQVYYHLGAFDDSLAYALGAGDLFDVNGHSEYVETIIGMVNTKEIGSSFSKNVIFITIV